MKTLLAAALLFASPLAHAATPFNCDSAPAAEKALWKSLHTYVTEQSNIAADMYLGQLQEFRASVDQNDPLASDTGPLMAWSEQGQQCIGADVQKVNDLAEAGHETAIRLLAIYSSLNIADGAFGEMLYGVGHDITRKYPAILQKVLSENPAYFSRHPLDSISWKN